MRLRSKMEEIRARKCWDEAPEGIAGRGLACSMPPQLPFVAFPSERSTVIRIGRAVHHFIS